MNDRSNKVIQLLIAGVVTVLGFVVCSHPGTANTPSLLSRPTTQAQAAFLPFFDRTSNPVSVAFPVRGQADITPPPPALDQFDQAVLQTCGPFGSSVRAASFRQLLSNYPDVLRRVQQAAGGELQPGRRTTAQFLDDMTTIWSRRGAFEHIFCGEIEGLEEIGGLHFVGRYLQLQNQGVGGRLPNNSRREEVVPGITYTLGVVVRQGDRTITDTLKGYAYLSNAEEMLSDVTRVFKAQGSTAGDCIQQVQDRDTGRTFSAVFVRDATAIITYYPDATPQGRRCRG